MRLLILALLLACTAAVRPARAQPRPIELYDMMSSDSFRRAGLNQLSNEQLRALNAWLSDWARAEFRRTERASSQGSQCLMDLKSLKGAWVIAHDGARLGRVIGRYTGIDSLYGSSYSATSLLNRESVYANAGNPLSPFNPRTETPPGIVKDGRVLGYLSINPAMCPRVDPGVLLGWLDK